MDWKIRESIDALNRVLEEDIVETVNHRLLFSLVENDLDVDQLNNRWCMQARSAQNVACRGRQQEDTSSLPNVQVLVTSTTPNGTTTSSQIDSATLNVPPRPPKNVLPNKDGSKNQANITERSRDFNSILTEFASHGENTAPKPIGRTPEYGSQRPILPPRPPKPVPHEERVESVTVRTNKQPPHEIVKEKSSKQKSYSPKFALAILKNIVTPSSSHSPTLPKKDFVSHYPLDTSSASDPPIVPKRNFESQYPLNVPDSPKNFSDYDSDHIYEPLKPREPINVISKVPPVIVAREFDSKSAHFPSEKEQQGSRVSNIHEMNAKRLNEELMRNRYINESAGTLYSLRVPNPALIPKDTDKWENIFDNDSRMCGSVDVSNSTMDNAVSLLGTPNESSIELTHQKTSGNGVQSPVESQNADCGPNREAHQDDAEDTDYEAAENTCYTTVVNSPRGTFEENHRGGDEIYYDTPEKTYYGLAAKSENEHFVKSENGPVESRQWNSVEEVYYDNPEKTYYGLPAKSENYQASKLKNKPVARSENGPEENRQWNSVEEVYYDNPEKTYYGLPPKSENYQASKLKNEPVTRSENGPEENRQWNSVEEVYYDYPEKTNYGLPAKSENDPIAKLQNGQIEKKNNNCVEEVYYDPVGSSRNEQATNAHLRRDGSKRYGCVEEVYCDPSEQIYFDPVEYWETASTASYPCSWLAEEPLYQLTENYDNLGRQDPTYDKTYESGGIYNFRPAPKELEEIHSRKVNGRTLWCNVESVISANVLDGLSRREKDLQEAKFEIYTTEFSFMKSLKILKKHFITSSEFSNEKILSNVDRAELFMYVKPLMARSKAFLRDLDDCWKKSIFMHGIFDVICKHARKDFDIYITYCSYLNDTIEKLNTLCTVKSFLATLKRLEQSEGCSKLPLLSFLTLPMERITSLDLLIKKALSLLVKEDKAITTRNCDTDHDSCLLASDYVKKVCEKSNAACNTKRRIKSLIQLERKLKYPGHVCPLSLISEKRWLIMFGEVTKHDLGEHLKKSSTISRSVSSVGSFSRTKIVLTIFLFNDYVILAKKMKSDGSSFKVVDYCLRDRTRVVLPRTSQTALAKLMVDSNRQYKMLLVMDENHDKKKVEMLLSCSLEKERDLWLKSISGERKESVRPEEKPMLYVCIYPFTSDDESQLSLEKGEEVTVVKKLQYGWLEGIRSRDKKTGIFPPSRVQLATTIPQAAVRTFCELYNV